MYHNGDKIIIINNITIAEQLRKYVPNGSIREIKRANLDDIVIMVNSPCGLIPQWLDYKYIQPIDNLTLDQYQKERR